MTAPRIPHASPELIAWLERKGAVWAYHCARELAAAAAAGEETTPPAPLAKTTRPDARALEAATRVLQRERDPR